MLWRRTLTIGLSLAALSVSACSGGDPSSSPTSDLSKAVLLPPDSETTPNESETAGLSAWNRKVLISDFTREENEPLPEEEKAQACPQQDIKCQLEALDWNRNYYSSSISELIQKRKFIKRVRPLLEKYVNSGHVTPDERKRLVKELPLWDEELKRTTSDLRAAKIEKMKTLAPLFQAPYSCEIQISGLQCPPTSSFMASSARFDAYIGRKNYEMTRQMTRQLKASKYLAGEPSAGVHDKLKDQIVRDLSTYVCADIAFVRLVNPTPKSQCEENLNGLNKAPELTAGKLGAYEIYRTASADQELIELLKTTGRLELYDQTNRESYEYFKGYNSIYFDKGSDQGELVILIDLHAPGQIEELKLELRRFQKESGYQAYLKYYRSVLSQFKTEKAALEKASGAEFRYNWRGQRYPYLAAMRINLEAVKALNRVGYPTCGKARSIQFFESSDLAVPVTVRASVEDLKVVEVILSERFFPIDSADERVLTAFRMAMERFESSGCKDSSVFPEVPFDESRPADVVVRLKRDSMNPAYEKRHRYFRMWMDVEVVSVTDRFKDKKLSLNFGKLLSPMIVGKAWDTSGFVEDLREYRSGSTKSENVCEYVGTSDFTRVFSQDPEARFSLTGKGNDSACAVPMSDLIKAPFRVAYGDVTTTEGEVIGVVIVEFLPARSN